MMTRHDCENEGKQFTLIVHNDRL